MTAQDQTAPNALAEKVKSAVLSQFSAWATFVEISEEGDLEIAVPAPSGSKAGSLVIATENGADMWIRFSPPYMAYPVENEQELLDIVKQLLAERASFAVIMEGEEWKETTLAIPNEIPEIQPGQTAQVVSWFGTYDREVA